MNSSDNGKSQSPGTNTYSVWNILFRSQKGRVLTEREQTVIARRWHIGAFIVLEILLLWCFELTNSAADMLGGVHQGSFNPLWIFFHGLKTKPASIFVLTAIAYIIASLIARMKKASFDAPVIVTDEVGDKVVLNSSAGVRGILTEAEEGRIFDYTELAEPSGVPIAINKNSGYLINKIPGLRTDIKYHLANDNILVAGPSGSGKTSGILSGAAASHIAMHHGCLIFDPKGDLYPMLKPIEIGFRRRHWLLNFKDGELSHSDGIDILKPIREADIDLAIQLVDTYTEIILENGNKEYWTDTIKNLFQLLLLYVTHGRTYVPPAISTSSDDADYSSEDYSNRRTWREFMKLVTTSSETLMEIMTSAMSDEYDHELLGDYYTTWQEDKNYSQIRSSLSNALMVFKSPAVIDILSSDEIDIDALADGDASIYVACSGRKETYIQVLTLFVNLVLDRNMTIAEQNGGALEHMLFIMLEEFNNLGRLDMLPKILSQNRSYNMGIMISVQTMNQLDKYNTDREPSGRSSIESACALQLCVGANEGVGSDIKGDTATYFSARAGKKERVDAQVTESRFKPIPEEIQAPFRWDQKMRTTMTEKLVYPPDRIQMITPDEIFISPGPHNCVIEKKYQWKWHPLYGTFAIDRKTGEKERFLTMQHTPLRKGGKPSTLTEYDVRVPRKAAATRKSVLRDDTRDELDFLV